MGRKENSIPGLDNDQQFLRKLNQIHSGHITLEENLPPPPEAPPVPDGLSTLELVDYDISPVGNASHLYKLRVGAHDIGEVFLKKDTIELKWMGKFSFSELEQVVFYDLPRRIYKQQTLPPAQLLRCVTDVTYRFKGEDETEIKSLKLQEVSDNSTYGALMNNRETLAGIAYTVKPTEPMGIKEYTFGAMNTESEKNLPWEKQQIRIIMPTSQGCTPSLLAWMLETIPDDIARTVDPESSAKAIQDLMRQNSSS